jgi:hypothetical protein
MRVLLLLSLNLSLDGTRRNHRARPHCPQRLRSAHQNQTAWDLHIYSLIDEFLQLTCLLTTQGNTVILARSPVHIRFCPSSWYCDCLGKCMLIVRATASSVHPYHAACMTSRGAVSGKEGHKQSRSLLPRCQELTLRYLPY